jgi:uncharacterized caspase-like protein
MRVARLTVIIAWSAVCVLLGLLPAAAEKRVALVIGNGDYKNVGRLTNSINDAEAIAKMLQMAGFDAVELRKNLGIRELRRTISEFSGLARSSDAAVVYYSGHGIEVDGANYLVPIDAVLEQDVDVTYETYSLENLLKALEPARRLRLVMLDACRDNPFARTMKHTVGTRAVGRGLAAVEPTSVNTLIGFAAKAGSYALDGEGANSPYATALLHHIAMPGLDLRIAFGRVRDEVLNATHSKQEPFVYGSLGGDNLSIVDVLQAPSQSVTPQSQGPAADPDATIRRDYEFAAQVGSKEAWQAFLVRHPKGYFAELARGQLGKLARITPPAAAVPPRTKTEPPAAVPAEQTGAQCANIEGLWEWHSKFLKYDVAFESSGSASATNGLTATWTCTKGLFLISWNGGLTDHMVLSSDGKELSGSSWAGNPISASRK